jgi:hypothetical protein
MALCAFAITAYSAVLIDELFESGYNRTANNIAGGNMAWFKGRSGTIGTANVGSLSFAASANGGADGEWGWFTDANQNFAIDGTLASTVSNGHVLLGVGDVLTASASLYFNTMPSLSSDTGLRFGLFDSPLGRSTTDFNGGPTSTYFTNNPGFATFYSLMTTPTTAGMAIYSHTILNSANIFSSQGNYSLIDGNGGTCNGLMSMTNYTLSFQVARINSTDFQLISTIHDTLTGELMEGWTTTTNTGVSTFNMMMLRWNRMPDSAVGARNYTELKVSVDEIPEPSTLLLAGVGLALAGFVIRRRR